MAPELWREEKYDSSVDIWSIGIITYFLIAGRPAFFAKSKPELFQAICMSEVKFSDQIWGSISKECKEFIELCLSKESYDRPKAGDLLEHAWLKLDPT